MKLKLLGLIAFLIIVTPQAIGAQDATPSPTPLNVGQIMRLRNKNGDKIQAQIDARNEKREAMALKREEKREQIQAKLTEKRQERIANLYIRIATRIQSAITRMTKLADRILARLVILEGEEGVTALQAEVVEAKSLIENVGVMLVSLDGVANDMLESDEPKAVYPLVKDSITEMKDSLKGAHSILVNVITQIKGLRAGGTE